MPFVVPMKWTPNFNASGEHDAEKCNGCEKIAYRQRI